jgi:Lrp/AsnC family leucine-responsive transcriptional regulator
MRECSHKTTLAITARNRLHACKAPCAARTKRANVRRRSVILPADPQIFRLFYGFNRVSSSLFRIDKRDIVRFTAMSTIDPTDSAILELLQQDGRMPVSELARAVGLPVSSVNDRVKRLQERGLIRGFAARIDPDAVGLGLLAFVHVGWSDPEVEGPFLARIAAEPAVQECHHVTGAWNYLLKVRVADTRMLERFLATVIKGVPGIQRTETLIALSSPKESCALALRRRDWAG